MGEIQKKTQTVVSLSEVAQTFQNCIGITEWVKDKVQLQKIQVNYKGEGIRSMYKSLFKLNFE